MQIMVEKDFVYSFIGKYSIDRWLEKWVHKLNGDLSINSATRSYSYMSRCTEILQKIIGYKPSNTKLSSLGQPNRHRVLIACGRVRYRQS